MPFIRPKEISGDDVQDYPVMVHALKELEKTTKDKVDYLVLLRPTSPMRPAGLIERAIDIIESDSRLTSVRSVVESTEHPYRQWCLHDNYMIGVENKIFEPYNIPRQKLLKTYFQSGDIELIKRSTILSGSISGCRVAPLILDHGQMLDIDNESDLAIAKIKMANDA